MTDDLTKRAQVYLDGLFISDSVARQIIAAYMQRDAEQWAEIERLRNALAWLAYSADPSKLTAEFAIAHARLAVERSNGNIQATKESTHD